MPNAPRPRPEPSGTADRHLLNTLLVAAQAEDQAFLNSLLGQQLPSRSALRRPASLRSTAEQRRIALRPFRLRTWFDRALHRAEQLLALAAVAIFLYWLADGYGRDWLYSRRADAPVAMAAPVTALGRPTTVPVASAPHLPALPFTPPDAAPPAPPNADYLAPQPLISRPQPSDPRPLRLQISAIDLDTPISEVFVVDGAWQVAEYAAGFHHGSSLPGQNGNTVLAGHAGLRGAVFRDLGRLAAGDTVVLSTGGWRYTYTVRETRSVWPTQVEVMDPTPTPVLTLITCTNWDTQRLIVIADLTDARPLS